jgi:tRNA(Arg) A34 adenosine deaminase TadA
MNTDNPNLKYFIENNKSISDLVSPENYKIEEGQKERHRLYCYLLMAITKHYWNGKKYGNNGEYPLNMVNHGKFENNDYLGHNIASIAVDAYGDIIDFEFNHNNIFNSTTEHAEARMIKRVISLTQINDSWKTKLNTNLGNKKDKKNTFEDVVIYTTLESCSQCAGIMALARVKEIVYLQTDPGMYLIGNILRNLTRKIEDVPGTGGFLSPMPISGRDIGLDSFDELNTNYKKYKEIVKEVPFYRPFNGEANYSDSVTSFLCTDYSYKTYKNISEKFEQMNDFDLKYPDYKPTYNNGEIIDSSKTNKAVLEEVKDFFNYAKEKGFRGTPHKI